MLALGMNELALMRFGFGGHGGGGFFLLAGVVPIGVVIWVLARPSRSESAPKV
jgi:hypothetical protein